MTAEESTLRIEHVAEFYQALGGARRDAGMDGSMRANARLAISPGVTHDDIAASKPIADAVSAFLDAKA